MQRRLRRYAGVDELAESTRAELALAREQLAAVRAAADERDAELMRRLAELEAKARIAVVMEWIRRADLRRRPLVSVVLPTRDRSAILGRAIDSVLAQSYESWELIAVDDGSSDETASLLAAIEDPRVRIVRTESAGVTAARNAGLAAARGELIAYLDDDNLMHDQWLRAVVWAFELRPESEVVYGAFVVDDPRRVAGSGSGEAPELVYRPFDRESLAGENPADMSAIAHRAGLAEARFDESLSMYGDWELLVRLTRERDPFAVPAIAAFYATDAPERLSAQPLDPFEHRAVLRAAGER